MRIHAAVGLCSAGCLLSLWAPLAGAVLAVAGLVAGLAALVRYARPLPPLPPYDAEEAYRAAFIAAGAVVRAEKSGVRARARRRGRAAA